MAQLSKCHTCKFAHIYVTQRNEFAFCNALGTPVMIISGYNEAEHRSETQVDKCNRYQKEENKTEAAVQLEKKQNGTYAEV